MLVARSGNSDAAKCVRRLKYQVRTVGGLVFASFATIFIATSLIEPSQTQMMWIGAILIVLVSFAIGMIVITSLTTRGPLKGHLTAGRVLRVDDSVRWFYDDLVMKTGMSRNMEELCRFQEEIDSTKERLADEFRKQHGLS